MDPREDVWKWTDGPFNARIDFRRYANGYETFVPALKRSLIPFVKGYSCGYVQNLEIAFRHFAEHLGTCPKGAITIAEISNYREKLPLQHRWRLGRLSCLFQKWVELGLPGLQPECAVYLIEQRKPGNVKGEAVRTRDPIEGPLNEEEYTALYSAVNAAYGRNELPLWALLLTRLLLASGGRISQYASLKVCDFDSSNGMLKLPQVKTGEVHTRTSFLEFDISPQTSRLIADYLRAISHDPTSSGSAFFPASLVMARGARKDRAPDDLFFGHCSPAKLSQRFNVLMRPIAPPTHRLDYAPIPLTAKRFRYTFGTRLAEEGASKVLIANRMGHTDLQYVDVYVAASPKIVENIDRAMGAALAPLARAFKGQLVDDEAQTTHKGSPGSRIIDFRTSERPVGSCAGKGQGCSYDKPVACYACFRFEPWLDAPHEKLLERLLMDRKTWSGDERMAAVNDESIRAIEEVVALCAEALAQRQNTPDGVVP